MRFQYGGTKKTIDTDRQTALAQVTNKTDKKRADAVNDLVDAYLSDKSIHDNSRVDVSVSISDTALSINLTLDAPASVVGTEPEAPSGKALSRAATSAKVKANATTNTIKTRTESK